MQSTRATSRPFAICSPRNQARSTSARTRTSGGPSYREAIAVFEVQLREFDTVGVRFETGEIAAYREGTVGWAACRPTLVFGDGSTATVRFTGVLRLEDGIWRVVQSHLSVGATNEETLGYEMTTTIEALADAVQQERPDLAAATAADGTVTIAFSDLEGSTELAVRLGEREVARPIALARSRRRVRRDTRER